jgi:hypothetical protein
VTLAPALSAAAPACFHPVQGCSTSVHSSPIFPVPHVLQSCATNMSSHTHLWMTCFECACARKLSSCPAFSAATFSDMYPLRMIWSKISPPACVSTAQHSTARHSMGSNQGELGWAAE